MPDGVHPITIAKAQDGSLGLLGLYHWLCEIIGDLPAELRRVTYFLTPKAEDTAAQRRAIDVGLTLHRV